MARIKLEMPSSFRFQTEMEVRITDLNYGNHLGNDRVVAFMHEARAQFFRSLGYGELEMEGLGIIVADCAVIYKAQAFFGDRIRIEVATCDFNKYGFDMMYRMINLSTGAELALAKTGIVCFHYGNQKVAPIPEAALKKLQG